MHNLNSECGVCKSLSEHKITRDWRGLTNPGSMRPRIEIIRCPSVQFGVHRLLLDNPFILRRVVIMPIPAVPPQGDAQLNDNARTVIGKRYLIKDATGTPVERPEAMFWEA